MPVPVVIDNSGANTTAGRVTRQNFPLTTDIVLVTSANQANIVGGVLPMTIDEYALNAASFAFDFLQSPNPIIGGGTTTTTIDADGTFTNSAGAITQNTANVWPLDYDPVTLSARGRPVWEARTNLLLRSAEFDNASWTKTNSTVSANAATSPDGTSNADKLIGNAGAGARFLSQSVALSDSTTYTLSMFVKAAGATWAYLSFSNKTPTTYRIWINLSTGALGSSVGSPTATSVESYGNGWYRVSITAGSATGASTPACFLSLSDGDGNTSFTGDGVAGAFLFGAQLEAGSFPTPYIPTTTASVTRSADACSIALPSGFNASEGTFVAEYISSGSGTRRIVQASDGTTSNLIDLTQVTLTPTFAVITGGASQCSITPAAITADTISRTAFAYKANDFQAATGGTLGTADTSGTVPTVTTIYFGSQIGLAQFFNGWLRKLYYFNTRLDDRNLQRAST